jgi:hypothetical protein
VTAGFDLSDAMLSVTWRSIGTHQVLAVYADRAAWYWALATIGAGSDVVGSFRTEVSDDGWGSIEELAGQVGTLGNDRTNADLGLALTAGQATTWVTAGSDEAATVASIVMPLVERARAGPVAATRFGTRVVTAPTGQPLAGFTFLSIGVQPVLLRLDPNTFALVSAGGDWRSLPAPRMGLVDASGDLLDGLYQTAEIPPGALGACTILLAETGSDVPARGALHGSLTLAGPWPSANSPVEAFEVSSAAVGLESP